MADTKITPFWFTFSFKSSGIVDSDLNLDDSKAELHRELSAIYGPEGYEVLDFHEATDEELKQYENWVQQMNAELEVQDPDQTIN